MPTTPTWERMHETEITGTQVQGQYDSLNGSMMFVRKYKMTGGEVPDALAGNGFTDWKTAVSVQPTVYDLPDAGTAIEMPLTCMCIAVAFTAVRQTTNVCMVDVTYEGHRGGYLRTEYDPSTRSERRLYDFNGYPTTPDGSGVQVILPVRQVIITENITFETTDQDITDKLMGTYDMLIGTCNEEAWDARGMNVSPGLSPYHLPGYGWKEASWQYMGPRVNRNRDASITLGHVFRCDMYVGQLETRMMNQTSWWFAKQIESGVPGVPTTQRMEQTDTNWPKPGSTTDGYTELGPNNEHKNSMYAIAGKTYTVAGTSITIPRWTDAFSAFSTGLAGGR